jgi:O-acetyl-ADP-ribose deacetylase (regulator of RNase III)
MITYTNKSIFDLEVDILVNLVNCVGVMGKGLALEFKNKYPKMFDFYKNQCKQTKVNLGIPYLDFYYFPQLILNA